ncbi:hypothetical protein [Streptomyces gibsoniae]|uniref:DUF2304 domain-containing protein n=1 Tax=Streptomyces gibsoniae TaxID=3075529 RepID=A0ABU2TM04_9ACTN|nr:hypothetical protein [Streptomyces sp. DSM 41699]MDT0461962.1 hypothetical protein [Streptomyces sp. DSM 41699]
MAVSISVVLLLLIIAVIYIRNGALKISHALICILLGFFLASSSMAPTLHQGLAETAQIVSGLHP